MERGLRLREEGLNARGLLAVSAQGANARRGGGDARSGGRMTGAGLGGGAERPAHIGENVVARAHLRRPFHCA